MRHVIAYLLAAALAECASIPGVNEGKRLMAEGRIDEGLAMPAPGASQ
jgi:hypothetical protein